MVELLARISCLGKFSVMSTTLSLKNTHHEERETVPNSSTVEVLLRVMDASTGKDKLIRADRRSIAVRKFNFLK